MNLVARGKTKRVLTALSDFGRALPAAVTELAASSAPLTGSALRNAQAAVLKALCPVAAALVQLLFHQLPSPATAQRYRTPVVYQVRGCATAAVTNVQGLLTHCVPDVLRVVLRMRLARLLQRVT